MKIKVSSPEDVGRVIRATRKCEHMRQDDAAGVMGLSDVSLGRIENGAPGARLDNVLRVISELGIELYAEVPERVAAVVKKQESKIARKSRKHGEHVTA